MAGYNAWADYLLTDSSKSRRGGDRDSDRHRDSIGYTRLLGDMDDMYTDSMSSQDRNRADKAWGGHERVSRLLCSVDCASFCMNAAVPCPEVAPELRS